MTVVVILLALVLLVLGLAASKPGTFRNERSTVIAAPAETIFPFVNDFHQWTGWSPWEDIDPAMERRYNGTATGLGSVYEWSGNKKVGSGRMEIVESVTPSRLQIDLQFITPFKAHNTADFTFAPADGGTTVTWGMSGPRPFLLKVMCLFVDLDGMVGKDFEKGLARLKALAEA